MGAGGLTSTLLRFKRSEGSSESPIERHVTSTLALDGTPTRSDLLQGWIQRAKRIFQSPQGESTNMAGMRWKKTSCSPSGTTASPKLQRDSRMMPSPWHRSTHEPTAPLALASAPPFFGRLRDRRRSSTETARILTKLILPRFRITE